MRKDMKKVIIERPRVGGGYLKNKKDMIDNDSPTREKMNYRDWNKKEQTDLLGPLYGFLRKNVGRKWDDVWSEICKNNKDYMGRHLKNHVSYMVELNCTEVDGVVYDSKNEEVFVYKYGFYVVDGILKQYKEESRKYKKPKSKFVDFEGKKYLKWDGIWYEVTVKQFDRRNKLPLLKDAFIDLPYGDEWTIGNILWKAYGEWVTCVTKKQIGSRLVKKIEKYLTK